MTHMYFSARTECGIAYRTAISAAQILVVHKAKIAASSLNFYTLYKCLGTIRRQETTGLHENLTTFRDKKART